MANNCLYDMHVKGLPKNVLRKGHQFLYKN